MVEVKKKGKKETNVETISKIGELKIGGSIIVTKKMWKMKTKPGAHLLRRRLGREFIVETLADDSGWKITAVPSK